MGAEKICLRPLLLSVKNTHCKLVSFASSAKSNFILKRTFFSWWRLPAYSVVSYVALFLGLLEACRGALCVACIDSSIARYCHFFSTRSPLVRLFSPPLFLTGSIPHSVAFDLFKPACRPWDRFFLMIAVLAYLSHPLWLSFLMEISAVCKVRFDK